MSDRANNSINNMSFGEVFFLFLGIYSCWLVLFILHADCLRAEWSKKIEREGKEMFVGTEKHTQKNRQLINYQAFSVCIPCPNL